MTTSSSWFIWALLSAAFAALTAIFAKLGIQGVDSDLATLIRTAVIIVVLSAFVWLTGKWSDPLALSPRTWGFLVLSGLATGAIAAAVTDLGDADGVAATGSVTIRATIDAASVSRPRSNSQRGLSGSQTRRTRYPQAPAPVAPTIQRQSARELEWRSVTIAAAAPTSIPTD